MLLLLHTGIVQMNVETKKTELFENHVSIIDQIIMFVRLDIKIT